MKNKMLRVLGVLATVATIMSLFVTAVPASAAAQSWTKLLTPGNISYIVDDSVVWNGPLERAINGDMYKASGHDDGDFDFDDGVFIYRSTDFGRTWTKTGQPLWKYDQSMEAVEALGPGYIFDPGTDVSPGPLVVTLGISSGLIGQRTDPSAKFLEYPVVTDIVCSSANANIVYVSDGYDIFKSVDAGSTWVALTNLFVTQNAQLGGFPADPIFEQGLDEAGFIVSFDVGYFGGGAYVFAACSTFGNTEGEENDNGGAYVLQESVYLQPWADMKIGIDRHEPLSDLIDVTEIKVMPDFSTTQGVMAVVTDYDYDYDDTSFDASGEAIIVTTKYGPAQWSQTANDVLLARTDNQDFFPVQSMLLDATIWFPSDFSSNPYGMSMTVLVGINPYENMGDVHLVYFGPPSVTDEPGISYDLNIRGSDTDTYISDMDGMGPIASYSVMASGYIDDDCMVPNTWTTRNGGVAWTPAAKRPTGGASPLYDPRPLSSLRVAKDFATTGKALIATHGIDAAVSYTGDWGTLVCGEGTTVWNGISQINTCVTEKHDMFVANDGTIYMSTDCETTIDEIPATEADELDIYAGFNEGTTAPITPDAVEFLCTDDGVTGNLTVIAGQVGVVVTDTAGQSYIENFNNSQTLNQGSADITPGSTQTIEVDGTAETVNLNAGGTLNITLPAGVYGTATSGTSTITGSPQTLSTGLNSIIATGAGNFSIILYGGTISGSFAWLTASPGVNTITVTTIGALEIEDIPAGFTGTVTSGTAIITGSPLAIGPGDTDIIAELDGTFTITLVGPVNSNIIWTSGTGAAGSTAVITLGGPNDYAILSALLPNTVFTLLPIHDEGDGTGIDEDDYSLFVEEDDPGTGVSAGVYNTGAHQVLISGTVLTTRTVLLPDVAQEVPVIAPFYETELIRIYVYLGSITVEGADPAGLNDDGTYGEGGWYEFLLNDDFEELDVEANSVDSQIGISQLDDGYSGTATYEVNEEDMGDVPVWDESIGVPLDIAHDATPAVTTEVYSLWRLYPGAIRTASDGATYPDWERINSWSLYTCPDAPDYFVDWDFVRGTSDNAAIFAVDEDTHYIYRSVDKGQTWTRQPQVVPFGDPGETIRSLVVVNPTTIIAGGEDGEIWFSNNLSIWTRREALPEGSWVTDIEVASNGDLLVAGVIMDDNNEDFGMIAIAKSVAATTNVGYSIWAAATITTKELKTDDANIEPQAFISPAADYATSGIYYYSGNLIISGTTLNTTDFIGVTFTGGVFQSAPSLGTSGRLDNDGEWYVIGNTGTTPAGVTGLVTSAGGPGFTQEGTGMVYAVSSNVRFDASTNKNGVVRVKGRVATSGTSRAEMILPPSNKVNLYNLWVGPSAVGNTTLTAFGSDCNIYQYTDTINKAVTGLKATAVTEPKECPTCPAYSSTLAISWDAMANATHYFVAVDDATSWTSVYGAGEAAEYHGPLSAIIPSLEYGRVVYTNSATVPNLKADTKYNISVWALKYTGSGAYNQEDAAPEILEGRFLTSFGMGVTVGTPPIPVGSMVPAAAAINIPVKPTFQWGAVPGAINYTLQVSTLADFSTMVAPAPVTVTGTAYAWTGANLAYSSTYYWRVMATTANGASPWMTNVFTTLAATPSQLPPVTVNIPTQVLPPTPILTVNIPPQVVPTIILPSIVFPAQPTPVINLPAPIVNIPQATTPIYIWIIVAVGAVLTIAVIVLIIRTRRVV